MQKSNLGVKLFKPDSAYKDIIEIITKNGHRKNISRPKEKMISLKNNFIKKVTNEKINK